MIHTIQQAKNANARAGQHWFDADSMRFFGSRLPRTVIPVSDGALFVSSEQRPFMSGIDTKPNPRRYTVRHVHDNGTVSTLGEFQGFATNDEAKKTAKVLASKWGTGNRVEAVEFFYRHAGFSWVTGVDTEEAGHLRTAVELAQAESWARVALSFEWAPDGDADEADAEYCIARDRRRFAVASLGGIVGADHDYRRVVEAELAVEALDAVEDVATVKTWHPTRDGFGTVLGEHGQHHGVDGFPVLATGVTLHEARTRFGSVHEAGTLPVTVDQD